MLKKDIGLDYLEKNPVCNLCCFGEMFLMPNTSIYCLLVNEKVDTEQAKECVYFTPDL